MPSSKIPLLLLKTKSEPVDGYEELFANFEHGQYDPVFVPVLEHRFKQAALDQIRRDILNLGFMLGPGDAVAKYGAIIFTSQRAVEAFTRIIEDLRQDAAQSLDALFPDNFPLYVVGPATARGLRALGLICPILGEESGNGEILSKYILEHYSTLHPGSRKPSILFLVGEKRRDIIPKTLQSQNLPSEKRSIVEELVIYETDEMRGFKSNFSSIWKEKSDAGVEHQWVIVFSPTGCKAMLESLGMLEEASGKLKSDASSGPRSIYIATIGPTTRDFLITEFGFKPDAVAQTPSPEGIADAIKAFSSTAR